MSSVWVEAVRPRTLPLSVAPVVVGTLVAGDGSLPRFAGALTVSVSLQIGVNLANDLFDAIGGVDTPDRIGPRRVTAAGLVSRRSMRVALAACLFVAAATGTALALVVGWELLALGALCVVAALAYSGGPRPYASAGLGEISVFVFFGLVATAGTAYVQAEEVRLSHIAAAVPVGLLACTVMLVNNLRDAETDRKAGKRTLAVRLGPRRSVLLFRALVLGAFAAIAFVVAYQDDPQPLLALAAAPLAVEPVRRISVQASPSELFQALPGTLRLYVGFTALLALGMLPR